MLRCRFALKRETSIAFWSPFGAPLPLSQFALRRTASMSFEFTFTALLTKNKPFLKPFFPLPAERQTFLYSLFYLSSEKQTFFYILFSFCMPKNKRFFIFSFPFACRKTNVFLYSLFYSSRVRACTHAPAGSFSAFFPSRGCLVVLRLYIKKEHQPRGVCSLSGRFGLTSLVPPSHGAARTMLLNFCLQVFFQNLPQ